jgi:tetratricopeptide (TPR) repeat protein
MPIRYVRGVLGLVSFVLLSLVCLASGPSVGRAQAPSTAAGSEEKARACFRLGRAHYDNGNFAEAAVQFEEAYRISQRAALLYNIYLAYRDANDTPNAAEALRKYLALEKDIENRQQLESRLAALDRALAENPPPPTASAPPPSQTVTPAPLTPLGQAEPASGEAPPPSTAPEGATAASSSGGSGDILPIVLMGTGGAMVVGSVVTGMIALGKYGEWDDARQACTKARNCTALSTDRVSELDGIKSSGETLALVTDILMFGGLAVAGTGVVLFFVNRGQSSERAPSANLACGPSGCQGTWTAQF